MKIIVKNPTSSNIRTGFKVTPQSVTDISESRGAVSVDETTLSLCVASSVASELEDSYYTVSGIELKGNFIVELDGDIQPHIFNVELIRQYLHDLQILTAITTDADSAIIGFTSKTEKNIPTSPL